ncbi:sensor histidine kinase [Hyphococcus sp.]|uniref:sensor histidine kinase n=1 Tax=Hyphococcus sp. TaxID=2038636 RepID=UPI0037539FA1
MMRLSFKSKSILLYAIAGLALWVCLSILFGVTAYLDWRRHSEEYGLPPFVESYAFGFAPWVICGPLVFLVSRQVGESARGLFRKICAIGALAITTGAVIASHALLLLPTLRGGSAAAVIDATPYLEWGWDIFIFITLFLHGSNVGNADRALARQIEVSALRNDVLRTQNELIDFENHTLRDRFSSHFMLNAMSNIVGLIRSSRYSDAEKAAEILSAILRDIGRDQNGDHTTIRDELQVLETYLEFQAIRFPNFTISMNVDPDLLDSCIPRHILQPLVENAFKHGMSARGDLALSITGRRDGNQLMLTISNSIECGREPPLPAEAGSDFDLATGQGLRIVEQRLKLFFGGNCSLHSSVERDEHIVTIGAPWKFTPKT